MCFSYKAAMGCGALALVWLSCSPARAPRKEAPRSPGGVASTVSQGSPPVRLRPPSVPPKRRAKASPCRAAPRPRLAKPWNAFFGWLRSKGYHRRSYANSRQFTRRVGDDIRHRLRLQTRGKRQRAFRLAVRLLGLQARTVRSPGSKWDCTTRMLQLTAQARKLAGIGRISYTGYRRGRIVTVSGPAVFRGYHLSRAAITLMAVAHYRERKLSGRNMAWRSPLLAEGALWKSRHSKRLRVGDILWYPEFGPGHFGTVLHRSRDFLVVVEGYWRGQPTVMHIYKRSEAVTDSCVRSELARMGGFRELSTGKGSAARWATNVTSGLIDDKGRLRVGRHR